MFVLRMLVVPLSGSILSNWSKSKGLPFSRSLAARFVAASNSTFRDEGMPQRTIASSRTPSSAVRTIGAG